MSKIELATEVEEDGRIRVYRPGKLTPVFYGDATYARALWLALGEVLLGERPRTVREAARALGITPKPQDDYVDLVTGKRGSDEP